MAERIKIRSRDAYISVDGIANSLEGRTVHIVASNGYGSGAPVHLWLLPNQARALAESITQAADEIDRKDAKP